MAKERSDDRGGGKVNLRWPLLDRKAFARAQAAALVGGRSERRAAIAGALERAALEVSGAVGYERMTIERLIERSDANRDRFYRAFANKAELYAAAYAAAIDQLTERLLAAGREGSGWPAGFRAALEELNRFIESEPTLAKGIFAEVYVAGDAALAKRNEVFERLSRATDRARRETAEPRHSPPPITAAFILGGIEAAILKTFHSRGGDFGDLLPGLLHIGISFYFGTEAAQAEVRRLG